MADRKYNFRLTSEGVDQFRKEMEALGEKGEQALDRLRQASPQLARALDQAAQSAQRARKEIEGQPAALRALAAAGDEAMGSVRGMTDTLGPAGAALRVLGPAGIAASVAIGGVTAALVAGAREAGEYEQRYARLQGVLRATGGVSGVTAQQIAALADGIEGSTMATEEAVLEAAAALATFRSVSGGAFTETLALAQDLAAVFGGDMRSATIQLGKALEDPVNGLSTLRRVGISFTEQQREQIKTLAESGRQAEAQRVILDALQNQVGGAGAAERTGLTGAVKGLGDAWGDLLKEIGKTQGFMTTAVNAVASGVRTMQEAMSPEGRLAEQDRVLALPGLTPYQRRLAEQRRAEQLGIIRSNQRDAADAAAGAEMNAARGRDDAEAERIKARNEALKDFTAAQERELELARLANAEREKAVAADKAEADLRKAIRDASPEEIAAARAKATAIVEQRQATEALAQAEKDRAAFLKDVFAALDDIDAKQAAARDSVDRQVEAINRETAALGMDETARRVLAEVMQAENELRKAGIDLQSDEAKARLANVEAASQEREVKRKAIEEQKQALADAKREAERATDNIVRYSGDLFADMFRKTSGGWKEMWQDMVSSAKGALARLAAEMILRPIIAPIVNSAYGVPASTGAAGGMAGGGATGGLGGLGGLGGGLPNVSGLFGPGWSLSSMFSGQATAGMQRFLTQDLGLGASTAFDINQAWGNLSAPGNMLGSFAVNMGLNALLGNRGAGADIGSTLGAIAGSFIPIPGGTIIGSAIGNIIGGMFGGKQGGFSGGQVNLGVSDAGDLMTTQAGFKRYDSAQAMNTAREFVEQINSLFDQLGLSLRPGSGNISNIGFGQEAASIEWTIGRILNSGAVTSGSGELDAAIARLDQSGSAQDILTRLGDLVSTFNTINSIDLNPDELTQVEQAIKGINEQFDSLKAKAEDYQLSPGNLEEARDQALRKITDGFNESIADQILGFTDPLALALRQLEAAQTQRLKEATAAGADLVEVERLSAMERAKVVEQYAKAANDNLRGLLTSITSGSASPLSAADTLANAETRFNSLRAAALGGDAGARQDISGAAQDLLSASRTAFASSPEYFQRYDFVVSTLRNLLGDLPGYADGTDSASRGWRWVGERGRELAFFNGGERVIPNEKLPGAAGADAAVARGIAQLVESIGGMRREMSDTRVLLERRDSQISRLVARRTA